jgi:hypothetical protein
MTSGKAGRACPPFGCHISILSGQKILEIGEILRHNSEHNSVYRY